MGDSVKTTKMSLSSKAHVLKPFCRPYNRYNLYFILERERLIQMRGGHTSTRRSTDVVDSSFWVELPPLPPRYDGILMPVNWYFPIKKNGKRLHRKTHGVASFRELARTIAASWKTIDDATLSYLTTVEMILKRRHSEINGKKISIEASMATKSSIHSSHYSSVPNTPFHFDNNDRYLEVRESGVNDSYLRGEPHVHQFRRKSYPDLFNQQENGLSSWLEQFEHCGEYFSIMSNDTVRNEHLVIADVDDSDIIDMWHAS